MLLMIFKTDLILTWSENLSISKGNRETNFAMTDTKHYVSVVTLSTHDDTKLQHQLISGFKRTIDWNKNQS